MGVAKTLASNGKRGLLISNSVTLGIGVFFFVVGLLFCFNPGASGLLNEIEDYSKGKIPVPHTLDALGTVPFLYSVGNLFLIFSASVLLLAVWGYVLPSIEDTWLMIFFIASVIFLMISNVLFGMALDKQSTFNFYWRNDFFVSLRDKYKNTNSTNSTQDTVDSFSAVVNLIHMQFGCCGARGASDFDLFPISCCRKTIVEYDDTKRANVALESAHHRCVVDRTPLVKDIYTMGCHDVLHDSFMTNVTSYAGAIIFLIILDLVVLTEAVIAASIFWDKNRSVVTFM